MTSAYLEFSKNRKEDLKKLVQSTGNKPRPRTGDHHCQCPMRTKEARVLPCQKFQGMHQKVQRKENHRSIYIIKIRGPGE